MDMTAEDFKRYVEQGKEIPEDQHEALSQLLPKEDLLAFMKYVGDQLTKRTQWLLAQTNDAQVQILLIETMDDQLSETAHWWLAVSHDPTVQKLLIETLKDKLTMDAQVAISQTNVAQVQILLIETLKDKLDVDAQVELEQSRYPDVRILLIKTLQDQLDISHDPAVQMLLIDTLKDKLSEGVQDKISKTGNLDVINAYLKVFPEPKAALIDVLMDREEPEIQKIVMKLELDQLQAKYAKKGLSGEFDGAVRNLAAKQTPTYQNPEQAVQDQISILVHES